MNEYKQTTIDCIVDQHSGRLVCQNKPIEMRQKNGYELNERIMAGLKNKIQILAIPTSLILKKIKPETQIAKYEISK